MWEVKCPSLRVCRRPGHLASLDQADSAWDISTGLQAFLFLLAWVRVGVRRVAVAAATVVVVECVFRIVVAFAVGEPVLTFVVWVHWLAVAGGADDLAPVWSGVSGAH